MERRKGNMIRRLFDAGLVNLYFILRVRLLAAPHPMFGSVLIHMICNFKSNQYIL